MTICQKRSYSFLVSLVGHRSVDPRHLVSIYMLYISNDRRHQTLHSPGKKNGICYREFQVVCFLFQRNKRFHIFSSEKKNGAISDRGSRRKGRQILKIFQHAPTEGRMENKNKNEKKQKIYWKRIM